MEQKHRTILRLHWSSISDNLEPKNMLPKLVTVLIETDEEDIKAQSTRQERCDKLLEILPRRGPTAFKVFVEALKQTVPHLAVDLIEADKKTEDELIDPRKQSARLIAGICKLKTELETEKQNCIRTLQGLKKMKTLHGKGNETKEEEITPDGLQKKEATTESLTQKEQDETRQKENFKEDDEQSNAEKSKCDALSEEVRRLKEISGQKEHTEKELNGTRAQSAKILREISDLNAELDAEKQNIETLEGVKSDIVARHSNTRDLTEITLELDELRKQCESLAKHLEEAQLVVRNLKKKTLTTTFQERATSPRDLEEFERTEGRTEHDRCDATELSEKLRGEIHQLKTELEAEKQDHIKTSQELEELKSRHEAHTLELADLVQQLRDVRHYAERENQSWEKEIQEWKTKSEKYEQENQALQKSLGSAMEKQERLEVLSSDLERANKAQREQIRQLQRMNEELQDKVTNERVLKTPVEIVQQHTGE
ncbi:uncharacterized protein LOC141880870 isoform X2 [Acropora palmata]|uniref:uncharacterized protein LOC141880870 isoform X2 n=1 Tax=Acropora palmata TaxID=6131 RepID=UPI003DA175C1